SHPEHGYYRTRDPLGAGGDFVTAPEISQMFGEMIGIWLHACCGERREPIRLVELGPGHGTLMADALRVLRSTVCETDVWLIETSPVLRRMQASKVPAARWAPSLDAVPAGPTLIVANEFFDALPVHQYLHTDQGWRECMIGTASGQFSRGLSGARPMDLDARDWAEHSPAADAVAAQIAQRLAVHGGAALIIDYGYTSEDRPPGPTLQAVRNHCRVDALDGPGETDLTWLIDMDRLADLATPPGGRARITNQGRFLAELGIGDRAAALARHRPDRADLIADALDRLTGREQMGTLFKALGIAAPGPWTLPAFESGT
ncbi:MAG: SAM-dependent methyltransferase, partial [Pseudomonadota bacterium]